jgi:hypothetical protein
MITMSYDFTVFSSETGKISVSNFNPEHTQSC